MSMATRAAWNGRGSWTRCRFSSRRTNGARSKPASIQRAELINRILADCYGPQNLIRTRWLPPALVFGQPDFLRPCHGIRPRTDNFLNFYAADLARSPDGRWWVISDRTQIPTGAGYALANRLVTSRSLPEAFRDCHVHRLAGFFREVQKSLAQLAPLNPENPRIVMLTPGPYNETYFEQAYLARYLGYQLVEGQDLTVRDDRVFLKTLAGLEARGRDFAPRGRRVLRSAGTAQRFDSRRARAWSKPRATAT